MSEQKILNPNMAVKMVQNTCKSAQTSTKILLCNHATWPKHHLAHTKSDSTGFGITSGVPVVSLV